MDVEKDAHIESTKLSWKSLPTHHLSCLGLKGLKVLNLLIIVNANFKVFSVDL